MPYVLNSEYLDTLRRTIRIIRIDPGIVSGSPASHPFLVGEVIAAPPALRHTLGTWLTYWPSGNAEPTHTASLKPLKPRPAHKKGPG